MGVEECDDFFEHVFALGRRTEEVCDVRYSFEDLQLRLDASLTQPCGERARCRRVAGHAFRLSESLVESHGNRH